MLYLLVCAALVTNSAVQALETTVRLVGGRGPLEGRVEIKRDGQFGTVCDDDWDDNNAAVICRMLGYTGGTGWRFAHYGHGSGSIWLDNVVCNGDEDDVFLCEHRGWGTHNCDHAEDAGVSCQPSTTALRFCPSGYNFTAGRCFKFLNADMTHADAMETCEYYHGGKVIDIKSLEDETFASDAMDPDAFIIDNEDVWLSITDDNLDGIFKYPDESPTTTYTPWNLTPDSSNQYACAVRNHSRLDVKWYASNCTSTAKTICEAPIEPAPESIIFRPIRRVRLNYVSASKYCQRLGSELVTHVTSYAERKRVLNKIKFRGNFFIGIDDVDNDGAYEYKGGSKLTDYRPFKNGKPRPGRCITIKKRRWYPKDCSRAHFFVCEKLVLQPKFEPILNKNTPFITPILGGNDTGKIIVVNGVSTANPERFSLNMLCGSSTGGDLVLHFDVRFKYGNSIEDVVISHKKGGGYSIEWEPRADKDFPFAVEVPFEIMVLIKDTSYKIAVNGQHFTEVPFPIKACADHLYMLGDVYMNEIQFL